MSASPFSSNRLESRMKRRVLVYASISLLCAFPVSAQEPLTEHTVQIGEQSAARERISINEMSWLAGHWVGEGLGGYAEEIWSPPRGEVMMGVFRVYEGDKPRFYEFLTLEEEAGSIVMRLKHFNPDFTGWEEKDKHVSFPFVRKEKGMYQFDGLTLHPEGDKLIIYVALRRRDGAAREEAFRYRRVVASDH